MHLYMMNLFKTLRDFLISKTFWGWITVAAASLLIFYSCENAKANNKNDELSSLIWSDEFEYTGLPDASKWSYNVGDACDLPSGCGWGNAELQYYTEANLNNARVRDGNLVIEAHKEEIHNSKYTSARLISRDKGDWKYGKIEVRAKLPTGRGTWPAIWMLPTNWKHGGWPDSGEIDIMEHVGYARDSIYGTVHTKAYNHGIGTQKGGMLFVPTAESEFHIYAINWTENKIDFLIDNNIFFTFENENKSCEEWPFSEPFYLILNLAVGGNWGGKKGVDDEIWPQRMEVDYVRVYRI